MPKIRGGRLDGVWGMAKFSAVELHQMADKFEAEINNLDSPDDPKWLQRWANKIRKLAEQKEKALEHKRSQ